ncbi:hypothetical protein D3C71_1410330 [compost metagenome]
MRCKSHRVLFCLRFFRWTALSFFASKPAPTVDRARLDNSVKCGSGLAREGARRVTPKTAESTHCPPPTDHHKTKSTEPCPASAALKAWRLNNTSSHRPWRSGGSWQAGLLADAQETQAQRSFRTNSKGLYVYKIRIQLKQSSRCNVTVATSHRSETCAC